MRLAVPPSRLAGLYFKGVNNEKRVKGGKMIKLNELTKNDVGRWVIYNDGFKEGKGKIKSWNEYNIFVVYKCNNEWDKYQDYTGCSTSPKDLRFMEDKIENICKHKYINASYKWGSRNRQKCIYCGKIINE